MEAEVLRRLARLVRGQRAAALGSLLEGAPYVSLVIYAPADDFSAFWLHLSRLALHARALQADLRAGLMISEPDTEQQNPLRLARVSLQGEVSVLPKDSEAYAAARTDYLRRFPDTRFNFELADFSLYQLRPAQARFVIDFGQIHDLTPADLRAAGGVSL